MNPNRGFDEVMIVNPYDPRLSNPEPTQLMRFHQAPGAYGAPPSYGYYAEPPQPYGYYAEPPGMGYYAEPEMGYYGEPEMGYYGEPPEMGGYAEPEVGYYSEPEMGCYGEPQDGYGYYAEPPQPYGWYAEPPEMSGYAGPEVGYYAEPEMGSCSEPQDGYGYYGEAPYGAYPEVAGWGEGYGEDPVGYYAEEQPMGEYPPHGYAAPMPELVGWGDPNGYAPLGEDQTGAGGYADYGGYAEPEYGGYVREVPPAYNPGCGTPTNVAGYEEADPYVAGYDEAEIGAYVPPAPVSAACTAFTPPPSPTTSLPPTFRPLW